MVKGIISSVILALAGAVVYFFIPYNRKSEPAKFFTLYGIVLLSALGYIIWQTTTIPDDITRGNDKFIYVLNHVLSTAILESFLFYVAGKIHGGRKYFSRVWEYLRK